MKPSEMTEGFFWATNGPKSYPMFVERVENGFIAHVIEDGHHCVIVDEDGVTRTKTFSPRIETLTPIPDKDIRCPFWNSLKDSEQCTSPKRYINVGKCFVEYPPEVQDALGGKDFGRVLEENNMDISDVTIGVTSDGVVSIRPKYPNEHGTIDRLQDEKDDLKRQIDDACRLFRGFGGDDTLFGRIESMLTSRTFAGSDASPGTAGPRTDLTSLPASGPATSASTQLINNEE